MPSSLVIHASNRLEVLGAALAERLRADPLPPLCNETILVPGQGMARWLQLQLAARLGVAATLQLPFPGAFLEQLCGPGPATAAFERSVLFARIFRLLGDSRLRTRLGAAWTYCERDHQQQKRSQLAERLAACFDDYQLYRPDLLLLWEQDRLHEPELQHERWQAQLWRALLREFGADPTPQGRGQGLLFAPPSRDGSHRVQRLRELLADPARALTVLPPRLHVFGLPTLPPAFLELLQGIAAHVPVTLWLHKATPQWFGDAPARRGARTAVANHPLLDAWGKQAREYLRALADADLVSFDDGGDARAFVDPGEDSLLHALQSDLLHQRRRGAAADDDAPLLPLRADDDSLRVHGAHSPLRELEIVRDQLLAAFASDPELRPGDVTVLVPDVHEYAPYVEAVFAPVQRWLPFAIADRSPASDLPLPAALLRLCKLAERRFAAPELLLLLEEPALARAFGIGRADVPALRTWVERAAIRWGIDGAQRQRDHDLPPEDANAWRPGLQRTLLGFATGAVDELVHGVLPAADGTAARADLLGRFLACFDALAEFGQALAREHTLPEWAALLDDAVQRLFAPVDDAERAGQTHLQSAARRLRELHELAQLREPIAAPVLHRWLERELEASGESRGFLGGSITVAALRPMRALPMRILCICGLGDGSFPRRDRRDPFDLVQQAPRPLDRSRNSDDRQLFLDSLLAARDKLWLTYVARSGKDDSECAPSPVLSELLEHLDRVCTPPAGRARARDAVFVQHPLQVWSPVYGGDDPRLFTFAERAVPQPSPTVPATAAATASEPLPAATGAPERIELDRLLEFWRDPAKYWCRHVLQVAFADDDEGGDDDVEPFRLAPLPGYTLRQSAVEALLAQRPDPSTRVIAQASGQLPPSALGAVAQKHLATQVQHLFARVRPVHGAAVREVIVRGADYELHGRLDGFAAGEQVLWRASKVKAKDLLRAWIRHVVLCAAAAVDPSLPTRTRLLGLDGTRLFDGLLEPQRELDQLIAGFRTGQRRERPLRLFPLASAEWAERIRDDDEAAEALRRARGKWRGAERDEAWQYDRGSPWIDFCWRDEDPLDHPEFEHWAAAVFGAALAHGKEVP